MIAIHILALLAGVLAAPQQPAFVTTVQTASVAAEGSTSLSPRERRRQLRAQRIARRRARHSAGGAVTGQDGPLLGGGAGGGSIAATGGVQSFQPVAGQAGGASSLVYIGSMTTGTGFPEAFVLHTPTQLPNPTPAPLLVVFHQFGKSHTDVLQTGFVQAAFERGWYVICPLGGSKKHFSSIPSQLNTEIVLDWLLSVPAFNIDTSRIYGVGFSMGGGAVSNYAARHKDPTGPVFAAIVNHTGTVSVGNAYVDDCIYFQCASRWVFDFWFGDSTPGSADPWAMARSSTLDYDSATLVVDPDRSLSINLLDTAVKLTRGATDTNIPYLPEQMTLQRDHMLALGKQLGSDLEYEELPYSTHDWNLLDYGATLDWLGQHAYVLPTSGSLIADGNRRYYHFDVVQENGLAFSPFSWAVDAVGNTVVVEDSSNVARVTVDTASAGLDTGAALTVHVSTLDNSGDEIRLQGYANAPSSVTRDGVATTEWVHDALLGTVTLQENHGAPHVWVVTP